MEPFEKSVIDFLEVQRKARRSEKLSSPKLPGFRPALAKQIRIAAAKMTAATDAELEAEADRFVNWWITQRQQE